MNTLKATRQEISVQLAAGGFAVYEWLPNRLAEFPSAVIVPASPYMEQGDTFTAFKVRFDVLLFVRGTNQVATDALDQAICEAIDALDTFAIESVGLPTATDVGGTEYLAAAVSLITEKDLDT